MNLSDKDYHNCLSNRKLQLILMPTEACNFSCSYCYEALTHGKMEPQVASGVKNLLSRRAPNLDSLTLSWFGGEPLLAVAVMEDILKHTQSLIAGNPRLRLFSDITTNGYLLSRLLFERLLDLGISQYQITLDGPAKWHDKKRRLANGRGTFRFIWKNLMAMREVQRDFLVLVRLHVDRDNYRSLPKFIEEYSRAFVDDARFKLFLRRISHFGGLNDPTLPVFEDGEGKIRELALSKLAGNLHIANITSKHFEYICSAARANCFVVRADGCLNKCSLVLNEEMNQVGRIREDGCLELDVSRMRGWIRGIVSGDTHELVCPMHGYSEPIKVINCQCPTKQYQSASLVRLTRAQRGPAAGERRR